MIIERVANGASHAVTLAHAQALAEIDPAQRGV